MIHRRSFLTGLVSLLAAAVARKPRVRSFAPFGMSTQEYEEWIEYGIRPPLVGPALAGEPASIMPGMITYVSRCRAENLDRAFHKYAELNNP